MNTFFTLPLLAISALLTGCATVDHISSIPNAISEGRERHAACRDAYEAERAALITERGAVVAELDRVKSGLARVENPQVTILKARRSAYVASLANADYELRATMERKIAQIDEQLATIAASSPAQSVSANEASNRVATIRRLNYQIENINRQLDRLIQRNVRGYCTGTSAY
jgi:hypothetical protein